MHAAKVDKKLGPGEQKPNTLAKAKTAAVAKVPPTSTKRAKLQAAATQEPQSSQGSNAWPEDRW
jgi:hypothetical protein